MKRADFVMREVHLSPKTLKLSFWTLAMSKMETITSLQLHTQQGVAIPIAPLFSLQPFLTGRTGFLRALMIYSSSFPNASSPGLGKGKINDSLWPCCRLLSASCQFFSPWEGFEMRLLSTDCP